MTQAQELQDARAAWDAIAAGYDRTNTPTQMWLGNEGLRRAELPRNRPAQNGRLIETPCHAPRPVRRHGNQKR